MKLISVVESIQEKGHVYRLWILFIIFIVSGIWSIADVFSSPTFPHWPAILGIFLLVAGLLVFVLFLLATMAPTTAHEEMFPLTLIPDAFWITSYVIAIVLTIAFILGIVLL